MAVIKVNQKTDRKELDKRLSKLQNRKQPVDLSQYFGKVSFGKDGLEYQLQVRK
jgi:hypothetical protein